MLTQLVEVLGPKLDRMADAIARNAEAVERRTETAERQLAVARLSMSMTLTSLEVQLRAAPIGTGAVYSDIFARARELGILPQYELDQEATTEPTIIGKG